MSRPLPTVGSGHPSRFAFRTRSVMRLAVSLIFYSFLVSVRGAEYTEITLDVESTFESSPRTNDYKYRVTCVVGTNDWFFSGDFGRNFHSEYWLVGTNVVERMVMTSSMYVQQVRDFISEKILDQGPAHPIAGHYPRAGETNITIRSWDQPFGSGVARVFWLAFCSGNYLQTEGRQIPLPIGHFPHVSGFSDKTILLEGGYGLPKNVQLFAPSGQLTCEYEVLGTTNFFGRRFPLS